MEFERDLSFSFFTVVSLSQECFAIFPMDKNIEQRICLKFCIENGISCAESLKMLEKAYGESTLSKTRAYDWYSAFKSGRDVVEDLPRSDRPSISHQCAKHKTIIVNECLAKNSTNIIEQPPYHLIWLRSTFFSFQNSNHHFKAPIFSR